MLHVGSIEKNKKRGDSSCEFFSYVFFFPYVCRRIHIFCCLRSSVSCCLIRISQSDYIFFSSVMCVCF